MARIKPGSLTPRGVPRSRGNFVVNVTRDGRMHAQAWPRKRGAATQGGALYQQLEFALVASWASNPEPIMLQSAIELVKNTDNVPRDVIMMASYGTYYDIRPFDGITPVSYRMVAPNAQLILDQVTSVPGSILYRAPIGWIGLPPGNNSFVLTMSGGVPLWLPAQSGGPGAAQIQWFTTPGAATYTIPPNTNTITAYMVGGGGGGASGRRTAVGTAASGGGGGGGGAVMVASLNVATLPAALTLNIGMGALGGAARSTDNTNGASGFNGQATTITNGVWTLTAGGGNGGLAGNTGTASGGAGGGIGKHFGGVGGACGAGSNGTAPAAITTFGSTGGGSGAGMPAVPAARNGSAAGAWGPTTGYPTVSAAGGTGSPVVAPSTGLPYDLDNVAATGGGGGGVTALGVAQNGATGGSYGGGGGGGAASLNGNNSGAGGNGHDGAILFIAW